MSLSAFLANLCSGRRPGLRFAGDRSRSTFGSEDSEKVESEYLTDAEMRRRVRENLFAVLQNTGWKIKGVDGAAELLGLKPTTLISRIEKMGLKRPAFERPRFAKSPVCVLSDLGDDPRTVESPNPRARLSKIF
jgi:hypothetical protein